jgi:hypothetical protein
LLSFLFIFLELWHCFEADLLTKEVNRRMLRKLKRTDLLVRIMIHCCAETCCAARGSLDHLVIRAGAYHEEIKWSTCCASRFNAALDKDSVGDGKDED